MFAAGGAHHFAKGLAEHNVRPIILKANKPNKMEMNLDSNTKATQIGAQVNLEALL